MPQPKKPGSPGRKPAARTPAPRRPTAPGPPRTSPEERREDQLTAAIAALRDVLSKGVVITGERLRETVEEAVRRGRMTRQDAEELVENLVEIGRRQAQDALAEVEDLIGRSATQTRRATRARAKSVGSAARRAPGSDRALRTVDRARRAAGLGQPLPIVGYEDLTTAQVKERLADLDDSELRTVRDHERRNANRKLVLAAIDKRLS